MTDEIMQPTSQSPQPERPKEPEEQKAQNLLLTELQQMDLQLQRRYLRYAFSVLATAGFGLSNN